MESLFNKVAGLKACNVVKKRCFSVNILNFLGTAFLWNTSGGWLPPSLELFINEPEPLKDCYALNILNSHLNCGLNDTNKSILLLLENMSITRKIHAINIFNIVIGALNLRIYYKTLFSDYYKGV